MEFNLITTKQIQQELNLTMPTIRKWIIKYNISHFCATSANTKQYFLDANGFQQFKQIFRDKYNL